MWQSADTMDAQNYLIKDLEKFFQLVAKTHSSSVKWVTYHLHCKDERISSKQKKQVKAACGQREAEAKKKKSRDTSSVTFHSEGH